MTANDRSGDSREERHPTPEASDRPNTPLEDPVASRATLARRLRAVERALAGDADVAFEPEAGPPAEPADLDAIADRLDVTESRLDATENRLDALRRAVHVIGRCLVARDRARRWDDGIESVREAIEALAESETGSDTGSGGETGTADRADTVDPRGTRTDGGTGDLPALVDPEGTDREGDPVEESPAEWLDRVAAGGVAPPRVE